ncbi:putative permease [Chiayiivirga flava]|uniref:Putative permease n=1 Tax=Chiayiivirga flava TaxID=659595 RepID=A0A7W8G0Z8_9GAMM|nr:putative permease [Chiayiivirga flava]
MLALALGIGAAGAMFAVVYGVLLAPLPYPDADRLVDLGLRTPGNGDSPQPLALHLTYARHARTLDGVGFHRTGSANVWTEGDDPVAQSVVVTWVSASVLPLLRATPLLGRGFDAEEELRSGPEAAILSEAEWRTRFGAAPDVIGGTVMVNSVRRTIVGVMPAGFAFPTPATRLWLPAKRNDDAHLGDFAYSGVARLAPGVTAAQAQRDLADVLPAVAQAFPRLDAGGSTAAWLADTAPVPVVVPLREHVTADIAPTLWMLAAAAGLVLLVAWANVANLLLLRADARQPEFAVRAALGAGRLRNAAAFLAEAVLLGATAGALALPLIHAAIAALVAFGPADVPRLAELGVGVPTAAFVALLATASAAVCAAVPAGRLLHADRLSALRDGARGASAGTPRLRLRAAITALQMAVALAVTTGSILLLRTAHALYAQHPGFDTAQVTTLRTQLPFARYDDAASVAFYARLAERVRALPSVRSAGVAMKVPLGRGEMPEETFRADASGRRRSLPVNIVDDGYFSALSIPLLAGRGFRPLDAERGTDVVISRRAAQALFDDADGTASVGRRLTLAPAGPAYTVIGVVGDVRDRDLATAPEPVLYRPLVVPGAPDVEPAARRNMALVVHASGAPDALVPALRQIVRELDPTVPVYGVETLDAVLRASTARLSLVLALAAVAAGVTLLLGAVGLYGVMSYMVALRTREFGIRAALGATPRTIARQVAAHALALTVAGIAVGSLLHAAAVPFLRALLYGVTAGDPPTLAAAVAVLLATAAVASWLPARRAARVAPAAALRSL